MKERTELKRQVLASFGRGDAAAREVLAYCANPFDLTRASHVRFPLADERHVADWRRYAAEAGHQVWPYLQGRLPQLAIPIRSGVSETSEYAAVMRRGQPFADEAFGERLTLDAPDALRLEIHEHPAGALPVLVAGTRADFERLYRALACRSEPTAVNASVNAHMIAGIVNWHRVSRYRTGWAEGRDLSEAAKMWSTEMARVAGATPEQFYDRLILITRAPYGGRTSRELGIDMAESAWETASTLLRTEHEFAHYATKRLYGTMRLNLLDEMIADAMGFTRAVGAFRASWFLGALGLGDWPALPATARVHTYRSGLSDDGFRLACEVAAHAASALESITARRYHAGARGRYLLTLTALSLDLLASPEAEAAFDEAWAWAAAALGE